MESIKGPQNDLLLADVFNNRWHNYLKRYAMLISKSHINWYCQDLHTWNAKKGFNYYYYYHYDYYYYRKQKKRFSWSSSAIITFTSTEMKMKTIGE